MIRISNLTAGYNDLKVITDISLKIRAGSITTIIGPNGSGKSTLLKCIGRQLKPFNGEIFMEEEPISSISHKAFARKVSYLKQSREVPVISVERLVEHGRFPYLSFPRKLSSEDKELSADAMKRAGVWEYRKKMLTELSGGECQKVYVAMALAQCSDILLLDEPTTYLDIRHQLDILNLICDLKNDGKTIITVLHDINSAIRISDNICLLNRGRLEYADSPKKLTDTKYIEEAFKVEFTKTEAEGTTQLIFR